MSRGNINPLGMSLSMAALWEWLCCLSPHSREELSSRRGC